MIEINEEEIAQVSGGGLFGTPMFRYRFKKGDDLTLLAIKYGTTLETLLSINKKIKYPSAIKPGTVIMIPYKE